MIKCDTCNKHHKVIFADTKQGEECASVLYLHEGKYYIQGFYGSYVADMMVLELVNDTSYNIGIICDACIEKLRSDKLIVKEKNTA
jgi:hypothetical protein